MEQQTNDELNVLLGEVPDQPTLEDMVGKEQTPSALPLSSIRNRAATLSLLSSEPAKATETYQLLVKEGQEGNQAIAKQLEDNLLASTKKMNLQGALTVLGDKSIPLAQKQAAIDQLGTSKFLTDSATTLHTNALAQGSKGETKQAEDARLSTSEGIREIFKARHDRQAIVNAHGAGLPNKSVAELTVDIGAFMVAPFGTVSSYGAVGNKVSEIRQESKSKWDRVMSYLQPGTALMDMKERLDNIPPNQQVQFAKDLTAAVQSSSGVVFGEDNHFAQMAIMQQIFESGGYSGTEQFIDNVTPILDAVGIGMAIRDVSKTVKAAKVAKAAKGAPLEPVIPVAPVAPVPKGTRATTPFLETLGQRNQILQSPDLNDAMRNRTITKLEEDRANLLGEAGNISEPGDIRQMTKEIKDLEDKRISTAKKDIDVTAKDLQNREKIKYSEAYAKAKERVVSANLDIDASITRLKNQIETNRQATNIEKQVQGIDRLIEDLRKGMGDTPGMKTPMADQISRVFMNGTISLENPASPAKILQQANPEQSRNLHEAIFVSSGDQVSEGLYGASRQDAIISDIMPQAGTEAGHITSKVNDMERNLRGKMSVPSQILKAINNSGATFFSEQEKRASLAVTSHNFTDVEGLTINDAMSSFRTEGGKNVVSAVYGTTEGSFVRAEEAVEQAKHALRSEGIMDNEIIVLEKRGLDHVPVDLESVRGKDGNYLIRVDTEVEIFAKDVGDMEKLDVKRNFLDRILPFVSKESGSLSRWIFDAASMLSPRITGAATVATDQTARFEKMMLDIASEFSDQFVKLPKDQQLRINSYIREANYQGIAFDPVHLASQGISADGVSTLKSWRDFWDAHFYLENYDVVRSLSSNGYMKFDNPTTTLFAKPIGKNANIGLVYDPSADAVRQLTKVEIDDLYNNGGSLARLRRPTAFGAETTEHMMVRGTPNEYLRKLRDTDQVLNYRDGYFQIQYTAPKFIEEIIRDNAGREIGRKVLAVAGDTREAESFRTGLARQSGKSIDDYHVRGDTRAMRKDDDSYWDLSSAGGRIAQRHRGKLLENSSGINALGDGSYILNPVDSARRAAMSISGRTVTRPMLDAAKERFLRQYGDALPNKNQYGEAQWPQNVKQIGEIGGATSKLSADARTTFEYIRYLENGYVNGIDEVAKWIFHSIANMDIIKKVPMLERAAGKLSDIAPSGVAKNSVFMAYIGTNIIRQWIVQPHQIVRTWAYNPVGWASGRIPRLASSFWGEAMGISTGAEGKAFKKFMDESGLMASVDKSNLIAGSLLAAADTTNKYMRLMRKPLEVSRKVGFDLGEQVNLVGHAAAVYEKKLREGIDLTNKAARDEAYSQIRAISGEMNFAGDMPYNQNSFSALLQFMQVPQKMLLQLTNRKISKADSLRIFAGDIIFWGPPTILVSELLGKDVLPDDADLRKIITDGVEAWGYNKLFSEMAGEPVDIDLSAFSPYEFGGWKKFAQAMLTGGEVGVLLNSPAGQLFVKDGGRVREAIAGIGRYFHSFQDNSQEKPDFLAMLSKVGEISSGWSNFAKARLLYETRKRMDQYGSVTDGDVALYEVFAQALGFGTTSSKMLFEISKSVGEDTKEYKDSVLTAYKDIKREYYNKFHEEISSDTMITQITGWSLKAYGDSPVAMKIIQGQLDMDLQGKDEALLGSIIKAIQIPTITNMRDRIKQAPLSDEKKQQLNMMIDDMEKTRLENKTDKE